MITGRQCPDAMHVIGQDHPGINRKGSLGPRLAHRRAQHLDMFHQSPRAPLRKRDGQKHTGTGTPGADVIRHGQTLPNQG